MRCHNVTLRRIEPSSTGNRVSMFSRITVLYRESIIALRRYLFERFFSGARTTNEFIFTNSCNSIASPISRTRLLAPPHYLGSRLARTPIRIILSKSDRNTASRASAKIQHSGWKHSVDLETTLRCYDISPFTLERTLSSLSLAFYYFVSLSPLYFPLGV